jgi:hypothetical protein
MICLEATHSHNLQKPYGHSQALKSNSYVARQTSVFMGELQAVENHTPGSSSTFIM